MRRTAPILSALVLATGFARVRADWTFSVLTPPASSSAQAFGLAHGGLPVFGGLGPIGTPHAGLWTSFDPASAIDLNPANSTQSAIAASTGVQHAGSAWIGGIQAAGIWNGNTASSFVPLVTSGYQFSAAYDTDGTHQVGSGRTTGGDDRALMWSGSAGSVSVLNPPNSVGAGATAEAAGRQVGWAEFAPAYTDRRAGFWSGTAASWTLLGAPAGFGDSTAQGISPDGQMQVGFAVGSTGVNWAAIWHGTPESFVSLHPIGRLGSSILDTDGVFEAGWTLPALGSGMRAALWQGSAASFFDLSTILPATYTISESTGVFSTSAEVWVTGYAYAPSASRWDAIVWHGTIPAPASAWVVLAAGVGAVRRRRFRR
jgi:hypothetical protein